MQGLFSEETLSGDECPIDVKFRDNLPMIQVGKYGARRSATCDFCKDTHDSMVEFCDMEVMGLDCTVPQIASKVTVETIIDQMYWERNLALAVIVKAKFTSRWGLLKHGLSDDDDSDGDQISTSGISLKSCFDAYSDTDLLTGDN